MAGFRGRVRVERGVEGLGRGVEDTGGESIGRGSGWRSVLQGKNK